MSRAGSRRKGAAWKVDFAGGALRVVSDTLQFEADPQDGVILRNCQWFASDSRGPLVVDSVKTLLCQGAMYDPRSLNRLADYVREGEDSALIWKVRGDCLRISGRRRVHDLVIETTNWVHAASGRLEREVVVRKTGPGRIKLQPMMQVGLGVSGTAGDPSLWLEFESNGKAQLCCEYGGAETVMDQDSHATDRNWLLSSHLVRLWRPGAGISLRIESEKGCLFLAHRPLNRMLAVNLYACDRTLRQGETLTACLVLEPSTVMLKPDVEKVSKRPIPGVMRQELTGSRSRKKSGNDGVADFRRKLHAWKLAEARWYWADGNPRQARALLRDAARIRKALDSGEPAVLPERGALVHETLFCESSPDWVSYGFGEMSHNAKQGVFVVPQTTLNLWSRQEFGGNYQVEFEYFPQSSGPANGGTFLQLSARPVAPRDPATDLMVSATGRMPDYNFGMSCYHFSFNRQSRERERTNFRKTGKAFYLLAVNETQQAAASRWHTIRAVKNGRQFLLFINNRFVLEYFDEGNQGPFLDKGHLGLRNWGGMRAWFRNLRVFELPPHSTGGNR